MLNGGYTFEKYPVPYKEGDVMLNGSSDERSQSLTCSLVWLWQAGMDVSICYLQVYYGWTITRIKA